MTMYFTLYAWYGSGMLTYFLYKLELVKPIVLIGLNKLSYLASTCTCISISTCLSARIILYKILTTLQCTCIHLS